MAGPSAKQIPYRMDGIHMKLASIPPGIRLECGGTVKTSLSEGFSEWTSESPYEFLEWSEGGSEELSEKNLQRNKLQSPHSKFWNNWKSFWKDLQRDFWMDCWSWRNFQKWTVSEWKTIWWWQQGSEQKWKHRKGSWVVEHVKESVEWMRKKWNFQVDVGREPSRLDLCQVWIYCYGSGLGRVWVPEGEREKEWKQIGTHRKSFGAEQKQKGLGFNLCIAPLCTQCPISESRSDRKGNKGELKSIFRLEIQEETSITMCFIWNKSGEIENGEHKVEYHKDIWTGMGKMLERASCDNRARDPRVWKRLRIEARKGTRCVTSEFQLGFSQLEPWYIYSSLTNDYHDHVTGSMEWWSKLHEAWCD